MKPALPTQAEPKFARRHYAQLLKRVGWVGFWIQLILGLGAGFILIFAREREIANHPGTEFGLFLIFSSLLVLAVGTGAKFLNIHAGRLLYQPDSYRWPRRQTVIQLCDAETMLHGLGMVLILAGCISFLMVLTSVAMTLVPGIINDPSRTIQPLDLLVLQASFAIATGHLVGLTTALWSIRDLLLAHHPPHYSGPTPAVTTPKRRPRRPLPIPRRQLPTSRRRSPSRQSPKLYRPKPHSPTIEPHETQDSPPEQS